MHTLELAERQQSILSLTAIIVEALRSCIHAKLHVLISSFPRSVFWRCHLRMHDHKHALSVHCPLVSSPAIHPRGLNAVEIAWPQAWFLRMLGARIIFSRTFERPSCRWECIVVWLVSPCVVCSYHHLCYTQKVTMPIRASVRDLDLFARSILVSSSLVYPNETTTTEMIWSRRDFPTIPLCSWGSIVVFRVLWKEPHHWDYRLKHSTSQLHISRLDARTILLSTP